MGKILGFFLAVIFFINLTQTPIQADLSTKLTSVKVSASVGSYYLSLSGFASPYASIVLKIEDKLVRSTIADEKGNFYISQVLIKEALSRFCLTTVDFKRIGESEACVDMEPAYNSVSMRDLFLPPTIGLSKKEIDEGQEAVVFGYTIPNATVIIHINKYQKITVQADSTGYYVYTLKNLKAGKYDLTASASYNGKESLTPLKPVTLESLSFSQKVKKGGKNLLEKIPSYTDYVLMIISIIIFIIIFILVLKLRKRKNKNKEINPTSKT